MSKLFAPLAILAVFLAGAAGYVMNLIDLVNWTAPISGEVVVRCIGVIIPLIGTFMGWFF